MPPLLPYMMKTPAEIQKAAIYCTKNFIEDAEKKNITARGLALHVACMNELAKRMREIEAVDQIQKTEKPC